jgi:hypothetical protein
LLSEKQVMIKMRDQELSARLEYETS